MEVVRRVFVGLPLLFLSAISAFADGRSDDEAPLVGQPPHFNGAVGTFSVTATADPVELRAEEPLTYTVTITANGPVKHPPRRPPLKDFPGFEDDFYIENREPEDGATDDPAVWKFVYRLRPKTEAVRGVPGFPFRFYKPGFLQRGKGFQTKYVPEIALRVTKHTQAPPKPPEGPELAFELAANGLARHERIDDLPSPLTLGLLILLPPVLCVAWYLVWRRVYPDALRIAGRRRSRAAREALSLLRKGRRDAPVDQARRAAEAVSRYLQQRLDLPVSEPTPAEVNSHLCTFGIAKTLAAETTAFLHSCDDTRYDPAAPARPGLTEEAKRIILALEAAICSD
jgi:hypothetical protein